MKLQYYILAALMLVLVTATIIYFDQNLTSKQNNRNVFPKSGVNRPIVQTPILTEANSDPESKSVTKRPIIQAPNLTEIIPDSETTEFFALLKSWTNGRQSTGSALKDYGIVAKCLLKQVDDSVFSTSELASNLQLTTTVRKDLDLILSRYLKLQDSLMALHLSDIVINEQNLDRYYQLEVTPFLDDDSCFQDFVKEIEPIVGSEKSLSVMHSSTIRRMLFDYGHHGFSIFISKSLDCFEVSFQVSRGGTSGLRKKGFGSACPVGGEALNVAIYNKVKVKWP